MTREYAAALTALLNGAVVPDLRERERRVGLKWSYWGRGSDDAALIEAAHAVNQENKGSDPHIVYTTNRIYRTIDEVREECLRTIREGALRRRPAQLTSSAKVTPRLFACSFETT